MTDGPKYKRKDGDKVTKKKKDKDISEQVLCAEYNALYRYVLTLCKNESDAQDITQDTFLKAMKKYDSFKGESSLYTWLCAIAKSIWLNRLKKKKREELSLIDDVTDYNDSITDALDKKDTALHIHTILHKIKEPYKEVFTLRAFGELSFAEIASLFSKTESWARVTYHRAKKIITEELRKDGYYE